jgi:curved DNA-binding protein CbpA
MRDHYEVLQVDPRADPEVIRAAYRVLARKYHPDHGGDPERMIALNDAWDVLGSAERRAVYDSVREASAGSRPVASAAPPGGTAGSPAASTSGLGSRWGSPYAAAARPAGSAPAANETDVRRAGPPPGNPSGSVLDFGQYAGWSLGEIARFDLNYLEWLQRSPSGRRLRDEIDQLLQRRRGAPPPAQPRSRFGR